MGIISISITSPWARIVKLRSITSEPFVSICISFEPLNHIDTIAFLPEILTSQLAPRVSHAKSAIFFPPSVWVTCMLSPSAS